ncbi:hypothetical protein FSP39_009446 [Pinctada imbricata]|uniref:Uncharacterized protein n=1 Tax=Pinctada imbricata TaxID=66713 RepID=A0AA89C921_PINIB|nr:hypothetical protein FSP39_009446 [Pinctada imbricata]
MDNDHIPVYSTKSIIQKSETEGIQNQDKTGTKANKQKPPPYEKKRTPDMGVRPGAQEDTTNKENIPSTTKTTVKLKKMTSIIRDIENTRNQNTFENESKECSVTALIILIVFFAFACVIQLPISIYFLITSMQKMEKKRSGGTSKSENGEDDYLLERTTTADYHQSHESIASKGKSDS